MMTVPTTRRAPILRGVCEQGETECEPPENPEQVLTPDSPKKVPITYPMIRSILGPDFDLSDKATAAKLDSLIEEIFALKSE